MDESSEDPRIGTILEGRYRVTQRLAEGAMGVVYRGERLKLGRPVAIKFLRASFAGEPQLLQRFEREARAMSRLGHPHCVSVMDFGVADTPYVVMEFVTGTTLAALIERGRLPVARALSVARQVLAGLAHAHGQGIVHRDIKPANVMLTEATGTGDHARILDFGLARMRDPLTTGDLSMASVVVGTPSYMSPEQTRGEKVDARGDVYSTGVVLFELLTGRKPFFSDESFEILRMHREEPAPSLADACPDGAFSPELEQVVARALAKDPEDRFASAMDFAAALEGVPEAARRPSLAEADAELPFARTESYEVIEGPPRRRRRTLPLLLVALLGIGAGALYAWQRERPAADVVAGAAEPESSPDLSPGAPDEVAPAFEMHVLGDEPDGFDEPVPEHTDDAPEHWSAEDFYVEDDELGDDDPLALDGEAGEEALPEDERDELVEAVDDDDEIARDEVAPDQPPEPPPAPQRRVVRNVNDVRALIGEGRRDEAIAGLHKLRREQPKSAYIPYLLGNLYFEKRWWSDGMKAYRVAIKNNRVYRQRAVLNKNVIRALGSEKTKGRAIYIFKNDIGRAGLRYLREAARSDRNPTVRRRAAWLVKEISGRPVRRRR